MIKLFIGLTWRIFFSHPERPHSLNAGQVDGGQLVDSYAVTDYPQRPLLEAPGAGYQLTLTLLEEEEQIEPINAPSVLLNSGNSDYFFPPKNIFKHQIQIITLPLNLLT